MVMCYTTLTTYMCVFVVHVRACRLECMCVCMCVSTCVDVSIYSIL